MNIPPQLANVLMQQLGGPEQFQKAINGAQNMLQQQKHYDETIHAESATVCPADSSSGQITVGYAAGKRNLRKEVI